jgi:hypothetical protein
MTLASRQARQSMAYRCCRAWELAAGWGKRGEVRGVLTEGFGGWFDGEARPAAMKGKRRW